MSEHIFDVAAWQQMSIFAQMGNIGSEVGRAAKFYQANDQISFEAAFRRALDLFDATIGENARTKSPRIKEVLRARDQFTSQFFSDSPAINPGLERYFMQFAIAERLQK